MKTPLMASIATILLAMSSAPVQADAGDILFRVGAAAVMPNDDSGEVTGLAGSAVGVEDNTQLGLTVSYMVNDNWAAELLAATPFKHDIKGEGAIAALGTIGETKHLPPTLMASYHFSPKANFRPYAGVGLNYTTFFSEEASASLEGALGNTDIELDDSFGLAAHVGFDLDINEKWFFNTSLWYANIETEATLKSGDTTRKVDVDINPYVVMVGVGTKF